MKKLFNYIVVPCTLLVLSCSNNRPSEATEQKPVLATWLLGHWENNTTDGKAVELWELKNDSTYQGKSYYIVNGDTVSSESLVLGYVNGSLCYIPTVKNQNGGQPVTFKLKERTENFLSFENPAHDFPQLITYSLVNADSLLAEISGSVNGKRSSQQFPMRRIK